MNMAKLFHSIRWVAITTFFLLIVTGVILGEEETQKADIVLLNGNIITMDDNQPKAQALAISGDRLQSVGDDAQIRPFIGIGTQVIDLKGKTVVPGLIDAHAHFMSLGYSRMKLDLMSVENWTAIVAMVEEETKRKLPGEWITGRGWHQDKWDETPEPNINGLPLHHELTGVSPDNPVILQHASGHMCIANARAMEIAGINDEIPDPDGGTIFKDTDGRLAGVFLENAMDTLYAAMNSVLEERTPEEIDAEKRRAIKLASEECLSKGLTGFHDAGASFETIELFKKVADEGKLGLRLWVMISEDNDSLTERLDDYKIIGYADNYLTVRAIKRVFDGALGSRGAWLLEPYTDEPQSTGLNTETIEYMKATADIAAKHGFQLCTHAIGDLANRETLNIYERANPTAARKSHLRWRVEHAQHLHPDDIFRFGELGVIASMQGIHCTSDGPWVIKRLGEKRVEEGAYVWQKLMKAGAIICNGTDAPVEDVDPIASFYASVSRKLPDGSLFYPDQRMSREEALRSYTINAAHAAFEEDIKGSLTEGKLADITILSQDILTVPEDEIMNTEVIYTIVGGKITYRAAK
jgi:predicted amidohydrolase YtcJ